MKDSKRLSVLKQYITIPNGNENFGIDIKSIDNIVRMQKITRVPKVQPYFLGVINLRGEIIPVMSMRRKMKLGDDVIDKDTRIIIIRLEQHSPVGIIVDSVKEVITLEKDEIIKTVYKEGEKDSYISGVGKKDDQLISLLDISKVITEQES